MSELARKFAAAIGIDAYTHGLATLRTAAADARAVAAALSQKHGYRDPIELLDRRATGDAIVRLLDETLPSIVTPDSGLVLYFAGHGVALEGDDGPKGYLMPQDAHWGELDTYLSMDVLRKALERLPCRHLLVVLDCCFAGCFRWTAARKTVLPAQQALSESQYERFLEGRAWQVLTSASHQEEAQDVLTPGRRDTRGRRADEEHSPFAAAFLEGLRGAADASFDGRQADGVITATELYQFIREEVAPAGQERRQTPGLWPLRPDNTGEFIFLNPRREKDVRPDPELDDGNNPWLGLTAYDKGDAALFFGRERVVEDLLGLLTDEPRPLLAVVGASGTGKSSLAKAGALPRLEGWNVVGAPRFRGDPRQQLDEAEQRLAGSPAERRALLFFDQFEELYSQTFDAAARDGFLGRLRELMETRGVRVLLTLRSDFEPRLRASDALGDLLDRGRYPIPAPTSEEYRQIIEKPAASRALYFEPPELVSSLVDEVMAMPGALPLLSFALAEMYREARRRRRKTGDLDRALTQADYENVGGVVGALHRRASVLLKEAYERSSLETVRRLALRMVSFEGGRITRRRISRREVEFADPEEQTVVDRVVRRLTEARLVVADEEYLEPAHDTLVLAWPRLLEWLDRYGSQDLQREVWRASEAWDLARRERGSKQARGQLWTEDPRLPQVLVLAKRGELNRLEGEFVAASARRRRVRSNVVTGLAVASAANVVAFAVFLLRRSRQPRE